MKAIDYHLQTKHYPNKFAKSLGYLDWDNQPSPYKKYFTKSIPLPLTKPLNYTYEQLYTKNPPLPLDIYSISKLFEYSLSLSAIKEYHFSRWAVRVNPSSGNLHPEESYIILKNKVCHFNPKNFALEIIGESKEELITNGAIVILTSIPLREAWKYGERALRYTLLDTGHAIGALRFASNLLGWKMKLIDDIKEETLKKLIGLDKQNFYENEEEIFEAAFYIQNPKINLKAFEKIEFNLSYFPLAKEKVRWDIIYQEFPTSSYKPTYINSKTIFLPSPFSADEIIRYRRSALNFKKSYIKKEDFLDILDKTLPRKMPPFDVGIAGKIDFLVFVNRVDGIASGLYFFKRDENKLTLIEKGDFSKVAKLINCNQDLGENSAFTLSMVVDKKEIKSDYHYKMAMFEAGMIGQILYLEAEAKNLRGCGIGCFFDDLITIEMLQNPNLLALYSFSIGEPIVDERIIPIKPNALKVE